MMVAEFVARQQSGSPVNGETPTQNHSISTMPSSHGGGNSNSSNGSNMMHSPDRNPHRSDSSLAYMSDGGGGSHNSLLGIGGNADFCSQRKQREFIPDNKKDDSYWDRRRRNNEAAKRSREKRRFNDMVLEQRVVELTKENHVLKAQLDAIKDKYNICGENLVSVEQIMATLPTTEQVLSVTKRAKMSNSVPQSIMYPDSPSPVPTSVIHQPISGMESPPPSGVLSHPPQQSSPPPPPERQSQPLTPHLVPIQQQQQQQHTHQPQQHQQHQQQHHQQQQQQQQQHQQQQQQQQHHHHQSQQMQSQHNIQHAQSPISHHHTSNSQQQQQQQQHHPHHSQQQHQQQQQQQQHHPAHHASAAHHVHHLNLHHYQSTRPSSASPSPHHSDGMSNYREAGDYGHHHYTSYSASVQVAPVAPATHVGAASPYDDDTASISVLNLSRRAHSPYEVSSGTGSGAASGTDDEVCESTPSADCNNSLPLKLRHKSHLGDKDAATALLALQHIKQEPGSRASPPWDGEGSSDERDSGISIGTAEWQMARKVVIQQATSPTNCDKEENIHLKTQIARLESEVATIKTMMAATAKVQ